MVSKVFYMSYLYYGKSWSISFFNNNRLLYSAMYNMRRLVQDGFSMQYGRVQYIPYCT